MTSGPGPASGKLPFTAEIAAYLADCAASPVRLDPAYHPTEDGAVKLVFHRRRHDPAADQRAEDQIRATFRALTAPSGRRTAPPPASPTCQSLFHLEPAE